MASLSSCRNASTRSRRSDGFSCQSHLVLSTRSLPLQRARFQRHSCLEAKKHVCGRRISKGNSSLGEATCCSLLLVAWQDIAGCAQTAILVALRIVGAISRKEEASPPPGQFCERWFTLALQSVARAVSSPHHAPFSRLSDRHR